MGCSIETVTHAGYPVVRIRGELDHRSCPDLDARIEELARESESCLVLDLLEVPYSEAAPLRAVLAAHRSLGERGHTVAIVCCAPFMDRLLVLAGLDEGVLVFPTLEDATAHFIASC